jgi:SMI1 / KNR4 family (SUKH-1)
MASTTSDGGAIDSLFARVAARAAATNPQPLPPVATEDKVAEAEKLLGFPLHPLLRRLYCEVADGGFGPDYLLLPLLASDGSPSVNTVVGEYLDFIDERENGRRVWPLGVVPILTYGCGMYGGVDCTDPDGAVLLYEPNGGPADPAEAWFLDAVDLATWLKGWITDIGWYREDSDLDDRPQELYLWEAASARLAVEL